MRVLVDTNLFVSYLLKPNATSASNRVVRAALDRAFRLLVPAELVEELLTRAATKPYLATRINRHELAALGEVMKKIGETIPAIPDPIPAVTRDPHDDYLIAYALVGRAEFLVTGDADLLTIGSFAGLKITTAAEFLTALDR